MAEAFMDYNPLCLASDEVNGRSQGVIVQMASLFNLQAVMQNALGAAPIHIIPLAYRNVPMYVQGCT